MKTWKISVIAVLSLLSIVACKSPVYVQKDNSVNLKNYHTYTWIETRANQNDNSKRATAYADMSVRNAVNAELSKQGFREVSNNADMFLSYDVLVERTTEQQSNPVYTQPFSRVYYNPYMRRWGTIYYPSQFAGYENYEVPVKDATITITMTDANTDKAVWQGWTTERLNYSNITSDEINKSVKNIFNKFDVAMR